MAMSATPATLNVLLSFPSPNQRRLHLGTSNQSSSFLRTHLVNTKSFSRTTMTVAVNASRFENITMAPPDPILGVSEAFKADTHEMKLNLGVGAYRTEDLQPYVLNVVKKAENLMLERGDNKEYLPIEGLAAFNKVTAELLFGTDNQIILQKKKRKSVIDVCVFCSLKVATIQGLSGTGSLRLAAALIERYFPGAKVLISSPTWGNHKNIFNDARVQWSEYRYYDPNTVGLDFNGMIADIKAAPDGSFILLHGCAHNPTGIDPTPEQWEIIADVIQEKNHIPFFDVAYQGFASGSLDTDASSVRLFAARGMELLVAQSYSKNLGLYAERIGAINVVCSTADAATRVKSQLKRLARPMYSNPPVHGARIVANVVGNPELFSEWKDEMEMMAGRIKSVRQKLYSSLCTKEKTGKDWSFILKQIGMFSFTGLNKAQSDNMTNKWHVYMTKDGRISLAGLSSAKCEYLADAIIDSYHNVS
ncbi:OLC1v1027936C1 [Oldenlandia corymbosa var. corymbosa]|uniref:Aspartate aminotransferase n=1 Tax=Oldenlandia corymbosa var. corymbosa TaxID=529605 RepID=A0AAV1CAJ9_OLDCO|nr:OLC1v1027936C1 [Oldenlandia corymbosa var. corymbosa]